MEPFSDLCLESAVRAIANSSTFPLMDDTSTNHVEHPGSIPDGREMLCPNIAFTLRKHVYTFTIFLLRHGPHTLHSTLLFLAPAATAYTAAGRRSWGRPRTSARASPCGLCRRYPGHDHALAHALCPSLCPQVYLPRAQFPAGRGKMGSEYWLPSAHPHHAWCLARPRSPSDLGCVQGWMGNTRRVTSAETPAG